MSASVELFLLKEIPNLGQEGDVVKVAPGYARNYLLPQGFAEPVTEAAKRRIAKIVAERERIRRETLADAQKLAKRLAETSVTIRAKVSDEENLYGSVNQSQILAALKDAGFTTLEERFIQLDEHLKKLGVFDVPVKIHQDVVQTVKVWIVAE